MTTMLEAALAYAKNGWPVFAVGEDKRPLHKGSFHDATTDSVQITKWWTADPDVNIAMEPGAVGYLVFDYHPGHDMAEVEQSVGDVPDTQRRTRTPRGGFHDWFATNNGEIIAASASKIATHVDVRSHRSYVLLPPSRTEDGDYTWERNSAFECLFEVMELRGRRGVFVVCAQQKIVDKGSKWPITSWEAVSIFRKSPKELVQLAFQSIKEIFSPGFTFGGL